MRLIKGVINLVASAMCVIGILMMIVNTVRPVDVGENWIIGAVIAVVGVVLYRR